jgi:hypothetical protein
LKRIPMSQEGRAKANRQQRRVALAAKVILTIAMAGAISLWGYLLVAS